MALEPMPQEDIEQPELPDLVRLLSELQIRSVTVDRILGGSQIHVTPAPDDELVDWIQEHFKAIEHLLPGVCDGCDRWTIRRIEAYWSARPHFCTRCHHLVIAYMESTGEWPEIKIEIPTKDNT